MSRGDSLTSACQKKLHRGIEVYLSHWLGYSCRNLFMQVLDILDAKTAWTWWGASQHGPRSGVISPASSSVKVALVAGLVLSKSHARVTFSSGCGGNTARNWDSINSGYGSCFDAGSRAGWSGIDLALPPTLFPTLFPTSSRDGGDCHCASMQHG